MSKSKYIDKRICVEKGCQTQPSFNKEGEKKGIYCSTHKKEDMVDVRHKKCLSKGCRTLPSFNKEGEKKGIYCSTHKKKGMVNVVSKKCLSKGCRTVPHYNKEGETAGIYCSKHKIEGMVNVVDKKCVEEGCTIIPHCNKEGETAGIYCSKHKKEGMVDVNNKKCLSKGCQKRPNFNKEGEKAGIYCLEHKKEGMVNVVSKPCVEEGCTIIPNYNKEGEKAGIYCLEHKKEGMVDVTHKTCHSLWCNTIVTNKYKGYCVHCFMHIYPDEPITRNYKTKEYSVVEYVKDKFPDVDWVADKKVSGGCSKKRPDLLLDLGNKCLIVEVDENQHTDYNCSCENERIMELSQDLGHRGIIFIRFNPDKYTKSGQNISSCWGINGNGICCVKKTKKKEWDSRLSLLEQTIQYWIQPENMTGRTIETIPLFYNQ